jgi:hypothetical protein
MNTRQYLWWEKTECSFIGIIAVCYLSSLMNLIIDGSGRKKKEKNAIDS